MSTFPLFGVHEVMTLGPERNEKGKPISRLGYFDNVGAALAAVEQAGDFKGAYIGVNPVALDSGKLNPESLHSQSNRARAEHVLHRVRLFLDFDPERPTDTNSTDEEKAGAYAQALEAREYLHGFGWPDPMLCDSGNGWHLLYRIQLPNDTESKNLIGDILDHLKSRYPMLDTTAGDANRFCKLYGTMTRKGPDSPERPWRRAAVIEAGSDSVVPEARLRAILPPRETKPVDNAQAQKVLEFLAFHDVATRSDVQDVAKGVQIEIECPWQSEHTSSETTNDTTVSVLGGKYGFNCLHRHCKDRHWAEFRAELEARTGKHFSFVEAGPDISVGTGTKQEGPPRTLGEVLKRHAEEKAAVRESFTDWREMFHTTEDILGCPNPSFLIQDFLQHQAIQAIAAPVGQRKSLIALNVARSLCTGEPLFGFLPVVNKPSRVLYLCPEMGTISISQRIKNAGLSDHVNKLLFVRSMNLPRMDLLDFPVDALPGSVLILDTAIRFMQGDENSAKDMRMFSDLLFDIQRLQGPNGAIIILYHSPKTTKDTFDLTLENCLRGSGELGAAVTDGWGTRMQDPDAGWDSTNFIKHIKVRDYPGPKDFEVSCDKPTGILARIGNPEIAAVLTVHKGGQKTNADGMDDAARAFIKAKPDMTIKALIAGLAEMGIKRKKTWVTEARIAIRGGGVKHTEG